jgi:predicted nucleotidyltransferase
MCAAPVNEQEQLAAWAAENPRIRRVWLFGRAAKRNARSDTDLDIAIEMEPVPDSEETVAYWIAHAEEWQAELEKRFGTQVDLEWFDPDVDAPLGDKAVLAYDRLEWATRSPVRPQPSAPEAPQRRR